jgi:hypothetical protein
MRPQPGGENFLISVAKSLNMWVIGVPGRRTGGQIIAAFRNVGAVSRSSAQRYRPATDVEEAAFRALLATEIIRQPELGRFFLDEAALDAWLGWRQDG